MPCVIFMAFTLLQMLRLQQHAFAPNYLFAPTHGFSVAYFTCIKEKIAKRRFARLLLSVLIKRLSPVFFEETAHFYIDN
jgi:hypothetical protein